MFCAYYILYERISYIPYEHTAGLQIYSTKDVQLIKASVSLYTCISPKFCNFASVLYYNTYSWYRLVLSCSVTLLHCTESMERAVPLLTKQPLHKPLYNPFPHLTRCHTAIRPIQAPTIMLFFMIYSMLCIPEKAVCFLRRICGQQ